MALGMAGGFATLGLLLLVAGAGSGVQHPLNATVVAAAWQDEGRRAAPGIYNFTDDLGKVVVPIAAALAITGAGWRVATTGYGLIGVALAAPALIAMRLLAAGDRPVRP